MRGRERTGDSSDLMTESVTDIYSIVREVGVSPTEISPGPLTGPLSPSPVSTITKPEGGGLESARLRVSCYKL